MSRLQVGGLALVVGFTTNDQNVGKTVKLVKFLSNQLFDDGLVFDVWKCIGDDLVWPDGKPLDYGYFEPKNLMPLGDKKTQDELSRFRKNGVLGIWYESGSGNLLMHDLAEQFEESL